MLLSRFFFHVEVPETSQIVLFNYLNGSVDLLDESEKVEFFRCLKDGSWENSFLKNDLVEKGYLFPSREEEDAVVQTQYVEFQKKYEQTQTQLIFSVTFACNFACSYCYQKEFSPETSRLTTDIIDSFFSYVEKTFGQETPKPYITLFGGEPLLSGQAHKTAITHFFQKAKKHNYELAIVTNGYELKSYVPLMKMTGAAIKEIQVTLDGDRNNHDKRRKAKNGSPTFDKIVEGIDTALNAGYRINLRAILDKENMESLPSLAFFCEYRGWLNQPEGRFVTALGRNYELYGCQDPNLLYTRAELYREFVRLSVTHPILKKFHTPNFHGMRNLFENGTLPFPIFDSCPACKKEWAFDPSGGVYGCTASVGVEKYRLGSFTDPDFLYDLNQEKEWRTRDVLSIPECRDCSVALSCGGGCGVLADRKNGKIHSPDCRPVRELVTLGLKHYNIT